MRGSVSYKGQTVDALVRRGDEGRVRLRKASGSCQRALIRGYPNGETQYTVMCITLKRERTWGSETSQYPQEKKSNEIPPVAVSERGLGQTTSLLVGL